MKKIVMPTKINTGSITSYVFRKFQQSPTALLSMHFDVIEYLAKNLQDIELLDKIKAGVDGSHIIVTLTNDEYTTLLNAFKGNAGVVSLIKISTREV